MSDGSLAGRGVLVVGASAGIGRAVAVAAVRAGATVVLSARREDRLAEGVDEAGGGTAVACDVTDDDACRSLIDQAADACGGAIDVIFYAAGSAPLRSMVDSDPDAWRAAIETNVLGLQRIVTAAVPIMSDDGVVGVLSSETVTKPRTGLGVYGASKAALEESLRAWRIEHPELRFTCFAVGATQPTEFGVEFDMEALGPAMESWTRHGLMQESYMDTAEVAAVCVDLLATELTSPSVAVEHVVLRSPSPVVTL
jgi:NADP-dependent 3-hydroxy acid dehydrogenase YdfG